MADETHEGWTNRETFAVALMIDNDEHRLDGVVEAAGADAREDFEAALTDDVARWIEADAEADELTKELATVALARVNWRELAEHYMAKAREQASA